MAEGKKSFILYADLISVVEKLIIKDREDSTNNAGELLYHILQYVNDRNPEPKNFIIDMAFEPIRLQLKRDLQKYECIREKRVEAGKQGGRPKKQTEAKKANGLFEKQSKAKKPVNVNVNVLSKDNNITPFDLIVLDWFEYKKERKESYKTEKSKTAFINKLKQYSNGNPDIARQIVDNSMANNWAGIFELSNKKNGKEEEINTGKRYGDLD